MSKVSKIDQIHIRAVMLCISKMSKILKQAITDFLEFISLLSKMSKINQIHLKTVMLCVMFIERFVHFLHFKLMSQEPMFLILSGMPD